MPPFNSNISLNKSFQLSSIQIFLVVLLLCSNVFLIINYIYPLKTFVPAQPVAPVPKVNTKVLAFNKFFIEKVLKATAEVDFDTRLKLEDAVKNIGDEEISAQWQKFVESKTEIEAQEQVKELLGVLVYKIEIK